MTEFLVEEHDCFRTHQSVFRAAKGKNIHSEIASSLAQGQAQAGCSICDTGAVHVQKHFSLMGKLSQHFDFFRMVDRPHLGGLRNRDDARLHVVLIPDAMVCSLDNLDGQLPIVTWNRNQFASSKFFGSATFVGIDMSGLGADHGMIRIGQRFET